MPDDQTCETLYCHEPATTDIPHPYYEIDQNLMQEAIDKGEPDARARRYAERMYVCGICVAVVDENGVYNEDEASDQALERSLVTVDHWVYDQYGAPGAYPYRMELKEDLLGNRRITFPFRQKKGEEVANVFTIDTYYDQWGTYYYFNHNGETIGTIASVDGTRSFIVALTQALVQLNMDQPRMKEPTKAVDDATSIVLGEVVLPYADALEIARQLQEIGAEVPWSLKKVLRNESYANVEALRKGGEADSSRPDNLFDNTGQIQTILNDVR